MRHWLLLGLLLTTLRGATATVDIPLDRFARVEVAPTRTSIYIGTVAMKMPGFARTGNVYESTYAAKVFPYFFYNESGRLFVEIDDAQLRRLARGEPIEFTGRGVRDDGTVRRVEGKATPIDAATGKLKVRVFVSKKIELIFNTTYRFPLVEAAK
jgi:hypothetical protein